MAVQKRVFRNDRPQSEPGGIKPPGLFFAHQEFLEQESVFGECARLIPGIER